MCISEEKKISLGKYLFTYYTQVYISLIDDVSVVKCLKNSSLVRVLIRIINLITSRHKSLAL